MITETEQRALQLAKKVFEHFTHDALPIAREILAMEHELGQSPINGKPVNGIPNPILQVTKTEGQPNNGNENDFPVSDLSAIGLDYDPAQPVKHLNEELEYHVQDDFPL
jgi:hypothetical protein